MLQFGPDSMSRGDVTRIAAASAIDRLQFGPDSMSRGEERLKLASITAYRKLQFGPDSMSRGDGPTGRSPRPPQQCFNSAPTR